MTYSIRFTLIAGLASCLALFGNPASAAGNGTGSIGYLHADIGDFDLGAIVGSLGYEFNLSDEVTITPEARIGFGVRDDNFGNIGDVELSRLYGAATRVSYNAPAGLYVFGQASYVNYEFKASLRDFNQSNKEDSWRFGFGAGIGYYFTERVGLEASYENVDSENFFTGSLRFRF